MTEKKYDPQVFTVFRKMYDDPNKEPTVSMKGKFGKFGVKGITVELNDGSLVELNDNSVFFLNDPRSSIEWQVNNGKLDADSAASRVAALDNGNVSREVVLKL
jgi:hypothetical protein